MKIKGWHPCTYLLNKCIIIIYVCKYKFAGANTHTVLITCVHTYIAMYVIMICVIAIKCDRPAKISHVSTEIFVCSLTTYTYQQNKKFTTTAQFNGLSDGNIILQLNI